LNLCRRFRFSGFSFVLRATLHYGDLATKRTDSHVEKEMMNRLTQALAFALCIFGYTAQLQAEPPDRFWAEDKLIHFGISTGLSSGSYLVIRNLGNDNKELALILATSAALLPGLLKEFVDSEDPNNEFSAGDMTANLLGATVGAVVIWALDHLLEAGVFDGEKPLVKVAGSGVAIQF
jgi:VanZ family protein